MDGASPVAPEPPPEAPAAAPAEPAEMTEEERKKQEQKEAMMAMAAAAAKAAEVAAAKRNKGKKGKKQKGSWDLLIPKDRHLRFWVEQFGRDTAAINKEAAKLQRVIDKKSEENRAAKASWEDQVKKALKFLYMMDKKVVTTKEDGIQAAKDLREKLNAKRAKYEKYWEEALALDPYLELVVDPSIGHTLSFVVLAQIAQPWGQLTAKLDVASKELEELRHFKDKQQYENLDRIKDLEGDVQDLQDWLDGSQDFLEELMNKIKRSGLDDIARKTDDAKHQATQTALIKLGPGEEEEFKNHAWFRSERNAYRQDERVCVDDIERLERKNLENLVEVLRQEVERLEWTIKESTSGGEFESYEWRSEDEEQSSASSTKKKEPEPDPFRPSCALPYDVPERMGRMASEMMERCKANTTNIRNPEYVVHGKKMKLHDKDFVSDRRSSNASETSSTNEFGKNLKKWPVTAKMLNQALPPWDPRKRPPQDEAPRNFVLASGRKPWDPSII